MMELDIAKIHESFQVTSLNPVTYKGQEEGGFMAVLEDYFKSAQEQLVPAPGMPQGVYTMNVAPTTRESLKITPSEML